MPYPKRIILETDYTCNLRCLTCNLWNKNFRKLRGEEKALTEENMKEIIIRVVKDGVKRISFIGGEPFLKPYIPEVARYAKLNGVITSVVTNGTLLSKELCNVIVNDEIFSEIIFSVDGYGKNHDQIRGEGVYEKVENTIKILYEIKKIKNKKKPSVMIYFTLSKHNLFSFESDIKKIIKLNPDSIRIQLASCVSEDIIQKTNRLIGKDFAGYHSYSKDVCLSQSDIDYVREKLSELKKIHGGRIKLEKVLEGKNESCSFLFKSAVITPSGRILPCPMLVKFDIGNIFDISLKRAFEENAVIINFIERLSRTSLEICRQCCVEKVII